MAEGKSYFESFANVTDVIAYVLVIICQYYFWRTGDNQHNYFIPDQDSYFEVFLLPMMLMLHLTLIFQHLIALQNFRFFIIMVVETMQKALLFYQILGLFIGSYSILLLFQKRSSSTVIRTAYTVTLGELDDYMELNLTSFAIFASYTILITLVLMNLVIAILSDKYESVTAER